MSNTIPDVLTQSCCRPCCQLSPPPCCQLSRLRREHSAPDPARQVGRYPLLGCLRSSRWPEHSLTVCFAAEEHLNVSNVMRPPRAGAPHLRPRVIAGPCCNRHMIQHGTKPPWLWHSTWAICVVLAAASAFGTASNRTAQEVACLKIVLVPAFETVSNGTTQEWCAKIQPLLRRVGEARWVWGVNFCSLVTNTARTGSGAKWSIWSEDTQV